MKKLTNLTLALIILAFSSSSTTSPPWEDLFNGKDFTGWTQLNGEAIYTIEGDVIVGTAVMNSPNSFLCTDKTYGDFILEFEVMVDKELNSGVQIRSESYPEYRDGRVHGYQVEIADNGCSGCVYDEARLARWLYPTSLMTEGAGDPVLNDWNTFRIECIGANIKTWVNGVPVTNLYDASTAEGFIGLQVHDIGKDESKEGITAKWRNIRIITENVEKYATETTAPEFSCLVNELTPAEIAEGWKLLFDGKTSDGWRNAYKEVFPENGWVIEDGILTVLASDGAESQNGGDIVTVDEYSNFDLQLEFKISEAANSGIKYYVAENEVGNNMSAIGLEFQILDDKKHPDAKLGNHEGSRTLSSLYDLIKASDDKRFYGVGKWNTARIISDQGHVEHHLNGVKVLEFERGSKEYRKLVSESKYKVWKDFGEAEAGHLLLQDHGDEVSFRSIKVLEL